MENRQLVRSGVTASLLFAVCCLALISAPIAQATGKPDPNVRFYKLNKKGQQVGYLFIRKANEPGCHDFKRKKPVQRFAQTGFAWCQLFSEKGCKPENLVKAMWDGRKYKQVEFDLTQPQPKLYEGSRWLLNPEENVVIRAWYCEPLKE